MIQATSIEAYHEIKASGLLSRRRFEVYEQIAFQQPVTLNKIIETLYRPGFNTGFISGRISELRRRDVIESCGIVIAPTGHKVLQWRITGRKPKALARNNKSAAVLLVEAKERIRKLEIYLKNIAGNKCLFVPPEYMEFCEISHCGACIARTALNA